MDDFESAKDKIYMGPERRTMVMTEDERRATAYHESGHAVIAETLEALIRSTRLRSCRAVVRWV